MSDVLDEMKEELKEYENIKKELTAQGEQVLKVTLRRVLRTYPEIEAISWTQYTPGFNDGDACEFTVGSVEVKFNDPTKVKPTKVSKKRKDDDEDETHHEDEFIDVDYGLDDKNPVHKEFKPILAEISNVVNTLSDVLEGMFGNGSRVIATKDGIKVEEYDCGF